ncbi:hypothetical protein [Tepidanaerobacter syntrophicus]|uniref:hypothetical protein n=1 Tax=Tepidanaerobacter syntrophicus TaxID=224999 RepID=UPI001BD34AA6|nr:hypothetical protein [Tepidanaerobacter syntrophicus]
MATYRQIHTKIWSSPDFQELSSDAKLVFIYTFSNQHRTESGIYKITVKTISNETDISPEDVKIAVDELCSKNLIRFDYDNNLIWVINALKYQKVNPNGMKAVIKDLNTIGNHEYVLSFLEYYAEVFSSFGHDINDISEHLPNTYPTPSKHITKTSKHLPNTRGKGKGNSKGNDKGNNNDIDPSDKSDGEATTTEIPVDESTPKVKPLPVQRPNDAKREEAKEVANFLKDQLKRRNIYIPKDWHLKSYACAEKLINSGVDPPTLKNCILWALNDQYWGPQIDSMMAIERCLPKYQLQEAKASGPGRYAADSDDPLGIGEYMKKFGGG